MTPESKLEPFGDSDPVEHQEEAAGRWSDTEAFEQSKRRTSSYAPQNWLRLQGEAREINERLLVLMTNGVPAESAEAAALVDDHRAHITAWFYDCSPEVHEGLGAMYVDDERFRTNIDHAGPGPAAYLSAAIVARCRS